MPEKNLKALLTEDVRGVSRHGIAGSDEHPVSLKVLATAEPQVHIEIFTSSTK